MSLVEAPVDPAATASRLLRDLYFAHGKHAVYQALHPSLQAVFGTAHGVAPGKAEPERLRWIEQACPLAGRRVLDIGANSGYFSLAALAAGASHVLAYEGHRPHAQFLQLAGLALGWSGRLDVQCRYFDFDPDAAAPLLDLTLCLNVLHHLGDDFGDREQSMATARAGMMTRLRRLAGASRWLVLQLGFNWMGDRHQPLFEHGLKQEIIDFVVNGCEPDWSVRSIGIYDPAAAAYVAPDASNLARRDDLGEFLNRPIFLLKSLRA